MTSRNSFGSASTLNVNGRELTYYSLRRDRIQAAGPEIARYIS